jgi:hypothetical protein
VQVAAAFAGGWQTAHDAPHAPASVSDAQRLPHRLVPGGQRVPQTPAWQVATPPGSGWHGVHAAPQVSVLSSGTHPSPQRW